MKLKLLRHQSQLTQTIEESASKLEKVYYEVAALLKNADEGALDKVTDIIKESYAIVVQFQEDCNVGRDLTTDTRKKKSKSKSSKASSKTISLAGSIVSASSVKSEPLEEDTENGDEAPKAKRMRTIDTQTAPKQKQKHAKQKKQETAKRHKTTETETEAEKD